MNHRAISWISMSLLSVGAVGGAIWILSLPLASAVEEPPRIPTAEANGILDRLKPRTRQRPIIAIVGINDATETTDYLMPYGVLRRADIADVVLLAPDTGPVKLYPALTVEPHATLAEFDEEHPSGADYVIVPAMSRDNDPAILQWLRTQDGKGAVIVGVCAGAKVVGEAGLLDNKRATTHWYYLDELLEKHPSIRYVADRRIVVDDGVATTTGISASMPMALTLIEAIGGPEKAEAVAREIGLADWDARHASRAFQFTRPFALTALSNALAFWNRDELVIQVEPGIDEVSLALTADAWSRTYRSRAVTLATTDRILESRNGARIVPDRIGESCHVEGCMSASSPPAAALDETLRAIEERYGAGTASLVAMQLEYRRQDGASSSRARR